MPNLPQDIWVQLGIGGTLLIVGMIATFAFTIRVVNRQSSHKVATCDQCTEVKRRQEYLEVENARLEKKLSDVQEEIAGVKQHATALKADVDKDVKHARKDFKDWLLSLTSRVDKLEVLVASMYTRAEVDSKINRLEDHVDKLSGGK